MPYSIKICGVTLGRDVELVGNSGADYIGLLVDMPSPRSLSPARAAELASLSRIPIILLFFDAPGESVVEAVAEIQPIGVQIQGHEPPEYVAALRGKIGCEIWKGVHLPAGGTGAVDTAGVLERIRMYKDAGADKALLDTVVKSQGGGVRMGGTGVTSDWAAAAEITAASPLPVMLAGGLRAENVAEALRKIGPLGVDLASGVESSPGVKDPKKVADFVAAVRGAERG